MHQPYYTCLYLPWVWEFPNEIIGKGSLCWNKMHGSRATLLKCGGFQFFFRLCISKPWNCKSVVQSYSFLTATIWAAIRSKSRRPWELNLRPPLGSFSTNFNASKDWRALRAIPPDPARQWLGALPLLRRTKIKQRKKSSNNCGTDSVQIYYKQEDFRNNLVASKMKKNH